MPSALRRAGCLILCVPLLLAAILGVGFLLDRAVGEGVRTLYPRKYTDLVEKASTDYGVPASIIYAVMRTESNFRPDAVSHKDAVGLMQITADTYDWIYFLKGETADPDTLSVPAYNVDAGVYLLAWLYDYYGNWQTVYAAYNAGFSRVNSWLEDPEISADGVLVNIPFAETENYVRLVTATAETYRSLYQEEGLE